jgi:hypothetical protein
MLTMIFLCMKNFIKYYPFPKSVRIRAESKALKRGLGVGGNFFQFLSFPFLQTSQTRENINPYSILCYPHYLSIQIPSPICMVNSAQIGTLEVKPPLIHRSGITNG